MAEWVRQYGTFSAAIVAATFSLVGVILSVRWNRRGEDRKWLRSERKRTYTDFVATAYSAMTSDFALMNPELFEVSFQDGMKVRETLLARLSSVELLGPDDVASAASEVYSAIGFAATVARRPELEIGDNDLHINDRLELICNDAIRLFVTAAKGALGINGQQPALSEDFENWRSEDWTALGIESPYVEPS